MGQREDSGCIEDGVDVSVGVGVSAGVGVDICQWPRCESRSMCQSMCQSICSFPPNTFLDC